jgi:pyruvate/2-oxoglutarate dehydrogenase complex dihydrolipoamide acyltransferase (E2) component
VSESNGSEGEHAQKGPLRRTLDVCVFAPVGLAVTVVEDLPDLVAKGRRRVELELSNARIVGRFVVTQKQRDLSERLDDMWRDAGERVSDGGSGGDNGNGVGDTAATPAPPSPAAAAAPAPAPAASASASPPAPAPTPTPDPAAAAIVGGALAEYDTLSASQVVRRLESLGPDELRAVQRYEASHRNRRTILNRAGQLLDEGPSAVPTD